MKIRAGRSRMVAASSSSSNDDISLGASQKEAPTPPAPSTDAASTFILIYNKHYLPLKFHLIFF